VLHGATRFDLRDLSLYYLLNAPTHFRGLHSIVKNESIDVIIFANIVAGTAAVVAGSSASVPVVCDYLDHYPESASSYYANKAVSRLIARGVSIVMGWSVRNSTMNVAISDTFRDILVKEYGVYPSRVTVIPNGVDTNIFAPTRKDAAQQKLGLSKFENFLCLCYVGAIESWSDLETVASTVDHLDREGFRIVLFIVGGGLGTSYYSQLLSRFRDRKCITFTGFVSEEKAALYIG